MLRTRVEMKQKVGVMVGVGDHSLPGLVTEGQTASSLYP